MLLASDKFTLNCFARSLRFWGSVTAGTSTYAVFPATAFNALHPMQIYAWRLGPNNPIAYNLIALYKQILDKWRREYDLCSLQQLRWALTNLPAHLHSDLLKIYSTTETTETRETDMSTDTLPSDIMDKLTMHLAELEQALLTKDEKMPVHLRNSHQLLVSYPETVHLLTDAQIAMLIGAAQEHAHIQIVKETAAKGGSRKKITADDL